MKLCVRAASRLEGEATLPGDKSITHRALMLGALGDGASRISGYLDSGDCRATIGCLRALGVPVQPEATSVLVIDGHGLQGWTEPQDALDCVRSGTTMRLLAGLLAGQPFYSVLRGDAQLRSRPMARVIAPLREMGAQIWARDGGRLPPLSILGRPLQGTTYAPPMASAQVKSCVLLAGLYAEGQTTVLEPGPSRDHTERMLRARGIALHSEGLRHVIEGPATALAALDVTVPGDFSSAAYLIAGALLVPGARVLLRGVGVNTTRTGLLDVLRCMGAAVSLCDERDEGGEPVADLWVTHSSLRAVRVDGELVPRMIDEFPILALVATQAQGVTQVRDAAELRVKETDRIATTVTALRTLGARIEPHPDGYDIEGPTPLQGDTVDSHGDHRLAMTLAIAGLIARGETVVLGAESIADSFPGFEAHLSTLAQGAIG